MDINLNLRKGVNGYFTVEASLIVPMVVLLISFLLSLTFFLYQRCLLSQDAYRLAFWGSVQEVENTAQIEGMMKGKQKLLYGLKYMGGKTPQFFCRISDQEIMVQLKGGIKALQKNGELNAEEAAKFFDPSKNIRNTRLAMEIATEYGRKNRRR